MYEPEGKNSRYDAYIWGNGGNDYWTRTFIPYPSTSGNNSLFTSIEYSELGVSINNHDSREIHYVSPAIWIATSINYTRDETNECSFNGDALVEGSTFTFGTW